MGETFRGRQPPSRPRAAISVQSSRRWQTGDLGSGAGPNGKPEYEWLAIESTITDANAPTELEKKAISRITSSYTRQLEWTLLRDDIDANTIRRLLHHENDNVASAVAIGIWSKDDQPPSDPEIEPLWRKAIMRTREGQGHDYELGRILACDQDLAVEWLSELFDTSPTIFLTERSPAIDSLDEHSRIGLLPHLQPKHQPRKVTARIVGNNPAVYRALLKDDNLKDLHLAPLEGQLDKDRMGLNENWANRVKMALENGYIPEQIADATFPNNYGWSGPESQMWESWIVAFQAIPSNTPAFKTVQTIGIATAQNRKNDAFTREHKRQVYGDTYVG